MLASKWAAVSAARQLPGGAQVPTRSKQDGESQGRSCGGEGRAGERLLGEASGQGGAGGLPGADRQDEPRVCLAGAACWVRASVVT